MGSSTVETTASILVNNVTNVLNNKEPAAQRSDAALRPFAVTQWAREVLDRVAVDKMNRLMGRLKRSPVPKATLRLVTDHLHRAVNSEGAIVPMRFAEWGNAVMRTSLINLANHETWLAVWESLGSHRIPDPSTLEKVSLVEIQALAESPHYGELAQALLQATRIEAAQNSGIAQPIATFRQNIASLPEELLPLTRNSPLLGLILRNPNWISAHRVTLTNWGQRPAYPLYKRPPLSRSAYFAFFQRGRSEIFYNRYD